MSGLLEKCCCNPSVFFFALQIDMDDSKIECKNCRRPFQRFGRSGILRHVKVTKECKRVYSNEEIEHLEKLSDEALKSQRKQYRDARKKETKEYNHKYHQRHLSKIQNNMQHEKEL